MPLVHECSEPGCETLTMGRLCIVHERETPRPIVRLATAAAAAVLAGFAAAFLARARLL
jgi:hypothetical protein